MTALRPPTAPPSAGADDALRNLFAQRACDIPVGDDVASVAVGRARRISRRRMSIGGLAAAVAFVLTLTTALSARGWWINDNNEAAREANGVSGPAPIEFDPDATSEAIDYSPVNLRIDVTIGNRLWDSSDGRWLTVGSVDPVNVVRVPLGWLAGDTNGIRLVTADGMTKPVAKGAYAWTVNGDGSRIAMVAGTTLSVRDVTGHGAVEIAHTTVPAGETPIGFVASTVIMSTASGQVDAWRPGGTLNPSDLTYVYSSSQDETFGLVASPGSGRPCLAKVSAGVEGVSTVAVAGCHDLLAQGIGRAAVAPDGRHIAVPFDGGMWIINLARSVTASAANPAAAPVWVATCSSDGDATPVWQDASTVVTSARGALVQCGVDGVQRDVKLPKDVNASARLVPRHMPL